MSSARIVVGLCLATAAPDGAHAQAYPATKAGLQQLVSEDAAILPGPYASKLRKMLHDWETGIGKSCTDGPDGSSLCSLAAKDVIKDIQAHVFKIDGFVIDSAEWSDTMPSNIVTGLGHPDKPIILHQVFPQIVSPNTSATQRFNKSVTDFGLAIWSKEGGPPRLYPQRDDNEDVEVDYAQNSDALPGVISISFSWDHYWREAMHDQAGQYDFNWNVAQNRPVEVGDIFDPKTDWKDGLATAILAAFQNSDMLFPETTAHDLQDAVSDPARWAVTKSGLRVDTDTYEVGPYSSGAPSAVASWSSLKPYLKHGGLADP